MSGERTGCAKGCGVVALAALAGTILVFGLSVVGAWLSGRATDRAPGPGASQRSYTVQPGDTLGGIAARHGLPVDVLQDTNGITDPDRLEVGDLLTIPNGSASRSLDPEGSTDRADPESESAPPSSAFRAPNGCRTCADQVLIANDDLPGWAVDGLVEIINSRSSRRCWFVNQVYSALWDSQWRPRDGATVVCNWWVDRYVVATVDQGRTWSVEHTHNADEQESIAKDMGWPLRLRPEARVASGQTFLAGDPCTSESYFTDDGGTWYVVDEEENRVPMSGLWLEAVIDRYRQTQKAGEENLQRHLWNLGKGEDVRIQMIGRSLGACP